MIKAVHAEDKPALNPKSEAGLKPYPPFGDGPISTAADGNGGGEGWNDAGRDPVLRARRHLELLRLIHARGQVTVTELSGCFRVSPDTVRRDLDFLAGQKLLIRTHGGAVATGNPDCNGRLGPGPCPQMPEKERIARAARKLIHDGETLLINGGSTTKIFSEKLERLKLTIVTNNIGVPAALPADCAADVYVLGGRYRRNAHVTTGPMLVSGTRITVDTAVIGVSGITADEGLTAADLEESLVAGEMVAAARRTIVLADTSKLGKKSFAHICRLDQVQTLVTSTEPAHDLACALREARVEVIVATDD